MASIHLDEFAKNGKAILFEDVKGSQYKAVSNLFGTIERSRFMFRDSLQIVKDLIEIKIDPKSIFKNPLGVVLELWHWEVMDMVFLFIKTRVTSPVFSKSPTSLKVL